MTNDSKLTITQKELLIRIDERQRQMSADIAELKTILCGKVNDDKEYQTLKQRVSELWDFKNRSLGYAAGAGAIASFVYQLIDKVLISRL